MSSLLSTPVFVSGPDDKLATVDLYKASGKLINELRDISDTFNASALDALKGGNNLLDSDKLSIIKDFDSAKMGIQLDTDSLMKGLIATNPGMMSALKSLPTTMQGVLTKVKGFANITGTFNGIYSEISKANLSTLNGLGALINGVCKVNLPFNFTDKSALAQFSAALIIQASKVGIKGAFKAFVDNITDKKVLKGIVASIASHAVANSMTDLLKDVATSPAGKIMVRAVGGLTLSYLQNYMMPNRASVNERYINYTNARILLDSFDPNWVLYTRTGNQSYEGNRAIYASKDFITDLFLIAAWKSIFGYPPNLAALAEDYQSTTIMPPAISNMNTAIGTSQEAYLALVTYNLNVSAKDSLKQSFPFVYFN